MRHGKTPVTTRQAAGAALRIARLWAGRSSQDVFARQSQSMIDEAVQNHPLPLVDIKGTAFDCGRQYALHVIEHFPEEAPRLATMAWASSRESDLISLFRSHAPATLELCKGMASAYELAPGSSRSTSGRHEKPDSSECTSFAVSGNHSLLKAPISGQTKDTDVASLSRYLLLRIRPTDAPAILTLAYPGELLGYGIWDTGMALFRNSLHSRTSATEGIDLQLAGLLCQSQRSVTQINSLFSKLRIKGKGNFTCADGKDGALSLEFNGAGLAFVQPVDGILTHANHCESNVTKSAELYPDAQERENSLFRATHLRRRLMEAGPTLTAQRIYGILGDHAGYPRGICRHLIGNSPFNRTTATIIADHGSRTLHVSLGNPCLNWPTVHSL